MVEESLKVLLVEDNDGDARLLESGLRKMGLPKPARAVNLAQTVAQSASEHFDVVLLDLSLPDSQGLETIEKVLAASPALPIVVFTGRDDDVLGMEAIQRGAQDYLVKGQADGRLIVRAMRYAIERKRVRMELQAAHDELEQRVRERTAELENAIEVLGQEVSDRRHAEESLTVSRQQLLQITEAIPEVIWMASPELNEFPYVNLAFERVWGRPRESLYADGKVWSGSIVREDQPRVAAAVAEWLGQAGYGTPSITLEYRVERPDGTAVSVRNRAFAIRDERGRLLSICGIVQALGGVG
jgi:DNA-binding response OmpR family regulator